MVMRMRLIDADILKQEIFNMCNCFDGVQALVDEAPTIDAVEVVRCKDCVKRDQSFRCIALYYGFNPHDDWFCVEGERDNAEVEG